MRRSLRGLTAIAFSIAALLNAHAVAAPKGGSASFLPGSNSKEPVSIEADKLNYFDKEQKAVYAGNVVVVQGDTRLTCAVMTIFLSKTEPQASGAEAKPAEAAAGAGGPAGSQVKRMEATGPVTVVSKTQVATGDRGAYDKDQDKVWLFGNVTLSDGGNVTKGDKLTYNLATGEAVVEVDKSTERVRGQFIPSSGGPEGTDKAPKKDASASAGDKPKPQRKKLPNEEAAPKP